MLVADSKWKECAPLVTDSNVREYAPAAEDSEVQDYQAVVTMQILTDYLRSLCEAKEGTGVARRKPLSLALCFAPHVVRQPPQLLRSIMVGLDEDESDAVELSSSPRPR